VTWTCPACDREFAKRRAHFCAPGMPLPVWLDERTPGQRRAAEAVLRVAKRVRGLVIEAVGVGVLIKRERTIVELRPKTKWLDMSFITAETIDDDRIARTLRWGANVAYFVHLTDAEDVDAIVRGWLRRAFAATPRRATARRGTTR
jgi:hypothetical protein